METPITILYTYGLRGDLALLPRLFSFIRQLRAHFSTEPVKLCEDDPAPTLSRILLLDLGESCAPDVWHCGVTEGRSALVALDGMGYDAASVSGLAAPDLREKLGENVRLALVDEEHNWTWEGVQIALTPADATYIDGGGLHLRRVQAGQVGMAQIAPRPLILLGHDVFDLPAAAQPDPTIAGIVDFILSEARYTQKRRGG